MSLTISNITIQFLSHHSDTGEISIRASDANLVINEKIATFVESLHAIYNGKANKAYAHFVEPSEPLEDKSFVMLLTDYIDNSIEFSEFSNKSAHLLKQEIEKYDVAETGYLIHCHYEMLGGRYLLVALLPISEHFYVDGELNLAANKHLDTNKLQLAARIDLFEYQHNAAGDRYISFIKGRAGRKVSDFFLDFLGCGEGVSAKEQSQILVKAIEDFVGEKQLDPTEKQSARKDIVGYCKEQHLSGKEISLQEVSQTIAMEDGGADFYQFCQKNEYPLQESFPPEPSVFNKATKYSGYGAGISVSFERSHFGTDVVYNPHQDSLTLYKVPPNLKQQLLQLLEDAKPNAAEPE